MNYFLSSTNTIQNVHAYTLLQDIMTSGTSFPLIPPIRHNKVLILQMCGGMLNDKLPQKALGH